MYFLVPQRVKAGSILLLAGLLLSGWFSTLQAQEKRDTLLLSIPAAEKIFLQKNLSLLAARYNINANEALIRQAFLWDNPIISTDQNLYDQQAGLMKHGGNNGQLFLQVQQLIRTAGKRSKLAQLSEDNTAIARAQFDDIVRTLRYTLVNDMLQVQSLLQSRQVYSTGIAEISQLVNGMEAQLNAGNISLKDFTRLKALLFGLQSDVALIQTQLIPLQDEIKLILQSTDNSFVKPDIPARAASLASTILPAAAILVDTAKVYRPDLAIERNQLAYSNDNVILQKALAKPDVTLGLSYDQHSSYAPNYVGFQLGLPLPFLNRNQGNIRNAEVQVLQQKANTQLTSDRIQIQVQSALDLVKFYQQLNNKQQTDLAAQYEFLFGNMVTAYRTRTVGLLEFIDFINNYKDTRVRLATQQAGLAQAIAQLNYTVNKDIIPLQ